VVNLDEKQRRKYSEDDEFTWTELFDNQALVSGARTGFRPMTGKWMRLWLVNRGLEIVGDRAGKLIFRSKEKQRYQQQIIDALDYGDTIVHRLDLTHDVVKLYKRFFLALCKKKMRFRYNHATMQDWAGVIVILAAQVWSPQTFRELSDLRKLGDSFHWNLLPKMYERMKGKLDRMFKTIPVAELIEKNR